MWGVFYCDQDVDEQQHIVLDVAPIGADGYMMEPHVPGLDCPCHPERSDAEYGYVVNHNPLH